MKPRFLLFKASAGSGKTFNLAVQYIALLVAKQGDEYRHILAVTFTNKATAEMKQRIVGQLYAIGHSLPESAGYLDCIQQELRQHYRQTLCDEEVRQRCREALHRVLHDYGRFSVSTIDSFFQAVMRNMAHELGLNARLQVELNSQRLREAAVDNLVDALQPEDKKMLRWIEDYASELMDEGKRWDFRADLKNLSRWLFEEVYMKRQYDPANQTFDTTTIDRFRRHIDACLKEAESDIKPRMRHASEEYIRWATLKAVRRNLTPMALLGAIEEEVKRINTENNSFSLSHTPILLNQMVQDGDAPFIFEKMGTRYSHVMIDEFQDTSQLQWSNFGCLLLNSLAQGNLCMVVGDTKQSIYRWRNGDWHTLYHLDRNGIPGTTLDRRELTRNFRSQKAVIDFNNQLFPQAATRLDKLGTGADGSTLADIYSDVRQEVSKGKEQGGHVRIRLIDKEKETEDGKETDVLQELCQEVRRLATEQHVPYGEMAILVRTKTHIRDIIEACAQWLPEVQVISDEAFRLGYSPAVNILIHALQVLNEQRQEEPSPLPLRCLEKLYLCHVLERGFSPAEYCQTDTPPILPEAFTAHTEELARMPLHELCEHLYRILQLHAIQLQDNYLFTFFDELSAYLRTNPTDLPSFLRHWEETMKDVAVPMGKVNGIRIVTIHSAKGLQYHTVLMPFCDWPLEEDKAKSDNLIWCRPRSRDTQGIGTLPVRLSKSLAETEFEPDYREEHYQQRTDELNALYVAFTRPEHNLLAWGELSKPSKDDKKAGRKPLKTVADLLAECLPIGEDGLYQTGAPQPFQAKTAEESQNRMEPTPTFLPAGMCSYEGRISFRQSRPAAEFVHTEESECDETQLDYIEKGKLLHYIFSKIHQASDIDRVADEMMQRGVLAGEKQRKEVLSLARRGLRNPVVATWFDGDYQLFNESGIIFHDTQEGADSKQANHIAKRRPDRVMLRNDRVVVVDYKFGSPAPEHADQVREYMHLLQQMLPNNPVEGHLWYVYHNETRPVTL